MPSPVCCSFTPKAHHENITPTQSVHELRSQRHRVFVHLSAEELNHHDQPNRPNDQPTDRHRPAQPLKHHQTGVMCVCIAARHGRLKCGFVTCVRAAVFAGAFGRKSQHRTLRAVASNVSRSDFGAAVCLTAFATETFG